MPIERLSREERLHNFVTMDARKGKQIRHLNDRHQQVIAMRKSGRNDTEISEALNMSKGWVKVIRNSWLGEQEADRLDELRDDVVLDFMAKMRRGSDLAVDFLVDALDVDTETGKKFESTPSLKLKVATDFLDRDSRASKVTRTNVTKTVTHATLDDLVRIKTQAKANRDAAEKALKQLQIEQDEAIDVTLKEEQNAEA